MSKLLAATLVSPVLFAAACVGEAPAPDTTELPSAPIAFDARHAADQPIVIATGGTETVSFSDPDVIVGWSGSASAGFELSPALDIWPSVREQRYQIRALGGATGAFSIQTNTGVASGSLASADVAAVTLVPASYRLDGHSPFALDVSHSDVTVALVDAAGRRLVDTSLVATDAADASLAQTGWDTLALGTSGGTRTLHVAGDSFAAIDLTVAISAGSAIDRVDTETSGELTCFHAYAGNVEIAKQLPLTGTPDATFVNCQR